MNLKLAVLPGDGIGPEIMEQGLAVTKAVCQKFGHELSYKYAICGADAIDKVGDPFPEETFQTCMEADAVLFASVGDPKFDNNPNAKVRPEQGLLELNSCRRCSDVISSLAFSSTTMFPFTTKSILYILSNRFPLYQI